MMNLRTIPVALLLVLVSCASPPAPEVKVASYKAFVLLPQNYEEQDACPLILFLHGAGGGSLDMNVFHSYGLGSYAKADPDFPFVILAPQSAHSWYADPLNDVLDCVIEDYKIDEDRIYATGFSMGGYGTFLIAMAFPERFAAIAPICGWSEPEEAYKIQGIPVWMFHNRGDPIVDLEASQEMYDALANLGGNVVLTIYERFDHDAWTSTYREPALYEWFLTHTRR